MLRVESALRESIAGDSPFCLEESLRWARAVVGVDRELLKLGRRRLPNVRLHEKLLQAMRYGDAERLEDVIVQATCLGIDAKTLAWAREKLAALKMDWIPERTLTASDLTAEACSSTPVSHLECIICLETYREHDSQASLPCGHRFHGSCVKDWLKRRPECPVCSHSVEGPGICNVDVRSKPTWGLSNEF